jgi:hypothetical protein
MGLLDGFWEAIDAQCEEIRAATTVDELLAACPSVPGLSVGDGFFEGSGGDVQVIDCLVNGWTFPTIKASYYWVAQDRNGDMVTYVEGDLYRGNTIR